MTKNALRIWRNAFCTLCNNFLGVHNVSSRSIKSCYRHVNSWWRNRIYIRKEFPRCKTSTCEIHANNLNCAHALREKNHLLIVNLSENWEENSSASDSREKSYKTQWTIATIVSILVDLQLFRSKWKLAPKNIGKLFYLHAKEISLWKTGKKLKYKSEKKYFTKCIETAIRTWTEIKKVKLWQITFLKEHSERKTKVSKVHKFTGFLSPPKKRFYSVFHLHWPGKKGFLLTTVKFVKSICEIKNWATTLHIKRWTTFYRSTKVSRQKLRR